MGGIPAIVTNDTSSHQYVSFDEYCDRFVALEELVRAVKDEKKRKQKSRIIFVLMIPLLLGAQFGLTLIALRYFQPSPIHQEGGGKDTANQSLNVGIENIEMHDTMYHEDHHPQHSSSIDDLNGVVEVIIERNLNGNMGNMTSLGGMGGDSNGFCTSPGMVM